MGWWCRCEVTPTQVPLCSTCGGPGLSCNSRSMQPECDCSHSCAPVDTGATQLNLEVTLPMLILVLLHLIFHKATYPEEFLLGKCICLGYGKWYSMLCPCNSSSCSCACRLGSWSCRKSNRWHFSWRRSTRWMACQLPKSISTENVGASSLHVALSRGRVAEVRFLRNHGWISISVQVCACVRVFFQVLYKL